jgi:hypothetical protein
MNVFDEISDRLAILNCLRPMQACFSTNSEPIEAFSLEDLMEILGEVEEEYNIAAGRDDRPASVDPSWTKSISEHCEVGKQFSVSGSAEFIELVRKIAGNYGYSMHEWSVCEHHASLCPPSVEKKDS